MVVYTVMRPAMAPMANVTLLGRVCPVRLRLCTNCLRVVYVVKRTAELAPCRIICEFFNFRRRTMNYYIESRDVPQGITHDISLGAPLLARWMRYHAKDRDTVVEGVLHHQLVSFCAHANPILVRSR